MHFFRKKIIFSFLFIFSLLATPCFGKDDFSVVSIEKANSTITNLPLKGTLREKHNGYIYLDVSNAFIEKLFPLIKEQVKSECGENTVISPPSFYTKKNGIGAHISVMYENERVEKEIWKIEEIGQTFSFQIKEIRSVKILGYKAKKIYLLAVECPQLETLRLKYGLKPMLKGHDFHITLGTQKPGFSKKKAA